jgi:putative ABC transport system substrate-binding protein
LAWARRYVFVRIHFGFGGNSHSSGSNPPIEQRRLELARELVPNVGVIALLTNPNSPDALEELRDVQNAANAIGQQLFVVPATSDRDFEAAFATAAQLRAAALVISGADPLFVNHAAQLGALALRHSVPAIFQFREFAAAGGLMSYGGDARDTYRLAGVYTGRILKGEKPADLPVVQSTKVELILNLRTARALGITVPLPLSGRADEVIEGSADASSSRCSAARRSRGRSRRTRSRSACGALAC